VRRNLRAVFAMVSSFNAAPVAPHPEFRLVCSPADKGASSTTWSNGQPSILVASGKASERNMLAELLSGQGYAVSLAENGETALKRIKQERFDLVVASLVMPRIDGLELLKSLSVQLPGLPVVVLAPGHGKIDQTYLKCAALLGAAGSHALPFRPKAFLATVRKALGSSSMRPGK
jgi:DNA-binding NtrC family response regulator